MSDIYLKLENLKIAYKNNSIEEVLIENINLAAHKNELICIAGANGVGKSTLLKTIMNIIPAKTGQILLENKRITNYKLRDLAKEISLVATETLKIANMKVIELVRLGRFPHTNWLGQITPQDEDIVLNSLKMVGMQHFKNKYLTQISDGELQRVMIARSLAQQTNCILLDEPTAFLDISNKYIMLKLLYNLSKTQNKLIIFSSHDLNIVFKLADKIWLIADNKIIAGAPEDLILTENIFNIFDNKAINFNHAKMDFDYNTELKYPIEVLNCTNSELHYQMTVNSLKRINYFIDNNTSLKLYIIYDNYRYCWKICQNNTNLIFETIYDLISYLQKLSI